MIGPKQARPFMPASYIRAVCIHTTSTRRVVSHMSATCSYAWTPRRPWQRVNYSKTQCLCLPQWIQRDDARLPSCSCRVMSRAKEKTPLIARFRNHQAAARLLALCINRQKDPALVYSIRWFMYRLRVNGGERNPTAWKNAQLERKAEKQKPIRIRAGSQVIVDSFCFFTSPSSDRLLPFCVFRCLVKVYIFS